MINRKCNFENEVNYLKLEVLKNQILQKDMAALKREGPIKVEAIKK